MSMFTRMIRFGITGLAVTFLHVLIAVTLVEAALAGPAAANGIAFILAACTSYVVNAKFTFRARLAAGGFARFVLVTMICGGVSVGIAHLAEMQGLDYRIGILLVVLVVPGLSFLLHNFWSFGRDAGRPG